MADKLAVLARLRQLQTDLARRDLAHALRAETEAQAALDRACRAPGLEAAHLPMPSDDAADLRAPDARLLSETFARWLPASAATIARSAEAAQRADWARAAATTELATRKGALEAVATLQEERAAAARTAAGRRAQMALDEVAGRGR